MLSVTMRCVRARTHACTCLSHGFPAEKNRPTYMPRGYRSWMLGHDLGSILIHAMPCHVMLRTLLCPAACGPSDKFERNFETCAMGTYSAQQWSCGGVPPSSESENTGRGAFGSIIILY